MDEKRDLIKELDECQRHLTQLCADIEPEFLQLGRGLESIFQRAQDLSEQARGAVYLHATAHLREEGQTSAPGGPGIEADVAVQKIPGDVHAEMVGLGSYQHSAFSG